MKKTNVKAILHILMALVMIISMTSCAKRPEPASDEDSEPPLSAVTGDGRTFINTLVLPAGPYVMKNLPNYTQLIEEKHAINSDSIGWLNVPNTTIDDVILWYPGDKNLYYYRRNFEKRESFNGCFYADYRCKFDGGAAGLSPNTVVYGHSMSDDPLHKSKLFSPLKLFKDPEFAEENPYVYFSVADENLVWEIFAVFYATVDLPYNHPYPQDFAGIVNECLKRSIYIYDTQVSANDKILTLSTCTYSLPDGTPIQYPNDYRYVVMAKLVTDPTELKETASFEINPSPKDP